MVLAALAVLVGAPRGGAAERVGVVASIKPIHSLVAGVIQGVATPHLIVRGGGSPHAYAMKPSDARALETAKVVFWIGPGIEMFLEHAIENLTDGAEVVTLSRAERLVQRKIREDGPWAHQAHDDAESGTGQHEAHRAGDHETDPHVWLDPLNAQAMVAKIAGVLRQADPENELAYEANAKALANRLDGLMRELKLELAPILERPYMVFHDGFQYFEKRFGLRPIGSVTANPDRQPGAERIHEVQARIRDLGAVCIFTEPQFRPRLLAVVIEGTDVKIGVLDPLGASLPDGPDLYFALMRRNAKALRDCLGDGG